MRKKTRTRYLLTIILIFAAFFLTTPEHTFAADQPISISSCKLNKSGKKLTVKASVKEKTSNTKKKLYLLALEPYNSETGAKSLKPLASGKVKSGKISFTVTYKSSMLYKKFALAYKTKGKYQIISNVYYITNPEVLASYTGSGAKTTSKKGLQVENLEDSLELRTQHAVINWTASSLLQDEKSNCITYKYKGKEYYFNLWVLQQYDAQVQAYNEAGAKVTVILLLPNDTSKATKVMREKDTGSALYSSFKTSSKASCNAFAAMMTFLATRYGTKKNLVSGWILGNEVNTPGTWNYGGSKNLSVYMTNYARAFRICYNAVKSVSKNSKVYISLDYNWNLDVDGGGYHYFTSKSTLDEFYKKINQNGKIIFNIAYHAYSQGLVDPVFWDDSMATDSTASTLITFRNLHILTNYVKKTFGREYTIMLSEQSFNSTRGEEIQAAVYAYAYYISEANSMIESFIYAREIDNPIEFSSNCYWGLIDSSGNKRLIWDVFQSIDSKDSFKYTNPLLRYTDLSKWSQISGFKETKYKKMPSVREKIKLGSLSTNTTTSTNLFWYASKYADGYEIYRNDKRIASVKGHNNIGYTDKKVSPGKTYTYKVRMYMLAPSSKDATKRVKLYGAFSKAKKITVSTGQVQWNTDSCVVDGKNITLSWAKQKGISGYSIYRATSPDGKYKRIATTTKTKYKDTKTESGTTYYYKVRAFVTKKSKNYYGSHSSVLEKQALIQIKAKITDKQLVLSWSKWPSAAMYQIYCSTDGGKNFARIKSVSDPAYSCINYKNSAGKKVSFKVGSTYQFAVNTICTDGTYSPFSNIVSIKITTELVAPEKAESSKKSNKDTEELEVLETESTETESTETEETELESESISTEETEVAETESEATETKETEVTEIESESTGTEETEIAETESEATETEATETEAEATETEDTETEATETEETEATETETSEMESETASTESTEVKSSESEITETEAVVEGTEL